eukprot:gene22938-29121_t
MANRTRGKEPRTGFALEIPVTAEVMLPVAVPWTDKYRFFSIHVTADGQELLEKQVVTAPETWPFTRLDVIVAGQIDWD